MKPVFRQIVFTRIILALSLLCLFAGGAVAAPPKLELNDTHSLPTEVKLHELMAVSLKYTGDPPTKVSMVVLTPDGETVTVPGKVSVGEPTTGVAVTWPYSPTESGEYRYHFEAQAGDIGGVRFPATPENDYQFVVASPVTRYIVLGVGLLICLLLLPFVSYTATRSLNQRGDAAAAARVALLIGLVAYVGLVLCVLLSTSTDYVKWLSIALGGVLVLGVLVGLFSRRRAV